MSLWMVLAVIFLPIALYACWRGYKAHVKGRA